jgi:hypothetical protein
MMPLASKAVSTGKSKENLRNNDDDVMATIPIPWMKPKKEEQKQEQRDEIEADDMVSNKV